MDISTQHAIYDEFINRYERLIISRIKRFSKEEDLYDLFQDSCIHIYLKIPSVIHNNPDAFSSSSWVIQVVDNFLISIFRKKNAKKNIENKTISQLSDFQWNIISNNYKEDLEEIDLSDLELEQIIKVILDHISKKDALMLKLKYFYGKPSDYIAEKLNISHVNMRIKRIKEQIQKRIPKSIFSEIQDRYFEKAKIKV
jgi:RNA polymerase sigma factor (sigma-70 family)